MAALAMALCVGFNPMHAFAASGSVSSKAHAVTLTAAKKTTAKKTVAKKTTKTAKKPKTTKTTKTTKAPTAKTAVMKAAPVAKKTTVKPTVKPVVKATVKKPATVLPKTSVVTTAAKKTTTKKTTTKKSSTTAKKSSQPKLSVSAKPTGASADVENIVQPAAPADIYQDGNAEIVSDTSDKSGNTFVTKLISEDGTNNSLDQEKISAAVKAFISSVEAAIKKLL